MICDSCGEERDCRRHDDVDTGEPVYICIGVGSCEEKGEEYLKACEVEGLLDDGVRGREVRFE